MQKLRATILTTHAVWSPELMVSELKTYVFRVTYISDGCSCGHHVPSSGTVVTVSLAPTTNSLTQVNLKIKTIKCMPIPLGPSSEWWRLLLHVHCFASDCTGFVLYLLFIYYAGSSKKHTQTHKTWYTKWKSGKKPHKVNYAKYSFTCPFDKSEILRMAHMNS